MDAIIEKIKKYLEGVSAWIIDFLQALMGIEPY